MPFEKKLVDEIISINSQIQKSKITSLYFALPSTASDVTGFESCRTIIEKSTDFNYYKETISYLREKNFDFIYLLNSPKPLFIESEYFKKQLERLDKLINNLKSIQCYNLRVSNIQLIQYLLKNYPEMNIYASTSFEYTQLKQYQNFITTFPTVKQIVPSHDVNRNFTLLKNLKKLYPNINIELLANEGCLGGCAFRIGHSMSFPMFFSHKIYEHEEDLLPKAYVNLCGKLLHQNFFLKICTSNAIYPWQIEEYGKIGIKNFKLTGRALPSFENGEYFKNILTYLKGIDDYKSIENEKFKSLLEYISGEAFGYKIKDIKPYLPDLKYFYKHGQMCASVCQAECFYCNQCAEKMKLHISRLTSSNNF